MWSTFVKNHQKINRIARKKIEEYGALYNFPTEKQLRYFEGTRGPDGIKVKSPGANEPKSFYDPFDPSDTELIEAIHQHYQNLVTSLRKKDMERAAFDASWLAHTLVDGLTPAHHFPYEEEVHKLRSAGGGRTLGDMMRPADKISIKGSSPTQTLRNNWRMWGVKGLLLTHTTFEGGVAFTAMPMRYPHLKLSEHHLQKVIELGIEEYFKQKARSVALLHLYDEFYRSGWTFSLAQKVKKQLVPDMIEVVASIWYVAIQEANGLTKVQHANH